MSTTLIIRAVSLIACSILAIICFVMVFVSKKHRRAYALALMLFVGAFLMIGMMIEPSSTQYYSSVTPTGKSNGGFGSLILWLFLLK